MPGTRTALLLFAISTVTPLCAQGQNPLRVLTGLVVDEQGQPIAGAAVDTTGYNDAIDTKALLAQPTVETGADGRFTLELDERRASARILLICKRGRQAAARHLPFGSQERVDLGQLVLPPAATLVGRVRDEDGEPVAGVDVRVTGAIEAQHDREYALAGGESNKRGIFQVPCVPRTGLQLTLSKLGYCVEERLATHGTPLTLTLRRAPIARGIARTPDGELLANATVLVTLEGAGPRLARPQRSAEDGAFAVTAPPEPHRYRITVRTTQAPYLSFQSELLRGEQDQVAFREIPHANDERQGLTVRAVDKATGKPLPKLWVASSAFAPDNLQVALFHADHAWREHEGEARLELRAQQSKCLFVRAPGYALEVVTIPEQTEEPLVVELGPEAALTGKVVDDAGKPMVGVAVRALPDGTSSGSGGRIAAHWPRTDAQGRYRIGSLRDGKYQVQVYPDAFPASEPFEVTVEVGAPNELDLTIPAPQLLTVEIVGDLPAGPAPTLKPDRYNRSRGANSGFRHSIAPPRPRPLGSERTFSFGAVDGDEATFELFVPSRTRVGAGTTLHFEGIPITDGKVKLEVPELQCRIVRGRITTDHALPTERLAVLATREAKTGPFSMFDNEKTIAGVAGDGSFEIDLPHGSYCLQLADVRTGVVFHTEADDLSVDAATDAVVLRPALHWLEVRLETRSGQPAHASSFALTLPRPRGGAQGAFVRSHRRRNQLETHTVRLYGERPVHRWLMPAVELTLKVNQMQGRLQNGQQFHSTTSVATETVNITEREQRLVIEVPDPPTDAELEQRKTQAGRKPDAGKQP